MRLTVEVKKTRGTPVRLLVDFLRFFHSPEELKIRLEGLGPEATIEREYIARALKLAEDEDGDPRASACARHYNAHVDARDFKRALEVAEDLVQIRGHAKDWYAVWACLNELGREDEAARAEEKAIAAPPVDATDWFFKAQLLALTGRREEALRAFSKAVEMDSDNHSAWTHYGITLFELKRFDEALGAINRSVEIYDGDSRPWIYRGLIMVELGNLQEAVASYDRVI